MTFSIVGQIPSGKNAVIVTRSGMRFPAKRFKNWREEVLKQLAPQVSTYTQEGACLPLESTISLECEYTPGDRRTRDVPGMLDALLHVIVKAGLLVDDGLVWAVTWRRMEMDRDKPGLRFTLTNERSAGMSEQVTKSFTITASPTVMKRFERFLALLHYNSGWGHSANFVMPLDGDGADRFKVHDFKPGYHKDVEHIGSVGYGFEIALDDAYTTRDGIATPRHYLAKNGQLLRDGEVIKPARPVPHD